MAALSQLQLRTQAYIHSKWQVKGITYDHTRKFLISKARGLVFASIAIVCMGLVT